jgi:hypothetical protein
MIGRLLDLCARLDGWLNGRLGRPYRVVLSVGLVIEIVRRLAETPQRAGEARGLAVSVLVILLNAALLLHQLGELGERFGAQPDRRREVED